MGSCSTRIQAHPAPAAYPTPGARGRFSHYSPAGAPSSDPETMQISQPEGLTFATTNVCWFPSCRGCGLSVPSPSRWNSGAQGLAPVLLWAQGLLQPQRNLSDLPTSGCRTHTLLRPRQSLSGFLDKSLSHEQLLCRASSVGWSGQLRQGQLLGEGAP